MRAARLLPLVVLLPAGCIPPGITHGPRVREGVSVSGTVAHIPFDLEESRVTGVLSLRVASQERRAGRLGQQFTVLIPVPAITASLEERSGPSVVLLATGEFYRETDHPNSARVPRGWGLQGSLFSIAPYTKIGWYGERGGVHVTNGFGAYGGILGVIPTPERLVWWPSLTVELQPDSMVTAAFHLGGSLQYHVEAGEADYRFMVGTTFTLGGF